MTNSIQNPTSFEDLSVEFSVSPSQCLQMMDAMIIYVRDYASSMEEETICELFDIYDDLSRALKITLPD